MDKIRKINKWKILGDYGSLSLQRPKIAKYRDYYGKNHPQNSYSNNIITSIEFKSLRRTIGGRDMLIEDCAFFKGRSTGIWSGFDKYCYNEDVWLVKGIRQ